MIQPLKILQASAGSGKTFSLAVHYVTLLFSGANKYREILAVTFTNKATEEMKTRILEVLKGFATGNEKVEDYRKIVLQAYPELNKETLKIQADIIYRKILHDYNRFSVSTIDGFVQKVIRSFAFELGLEASYSLEMNYDKVKQELADQLEKELDSNPVLLQWIIDLAIERIGNNQSWNYRRELLDLTSELFKERFQPFEKALLGFADPSELDRLFATYNADNRARITAFEQQIHALATTALQVFQVECPDTTHLKGKSRSPLNNLQRIADGDMSKIAGLTKLIDQPDEWMQKGEADHLYQQLNPLLQELITAYKEGLPHHILTKAFSKNLHYLRLMQEMATFLKKYRAENSNLLISDAQNLLKGLTDDAGDNPSFIWEKVGNRYRNFLFDEFQDTSANQWSSFMPLLANAIAAPDEGLINHLIVGDAKQSIYRWRNGDWNILHRKAKEDIGAFNVIEESLPENYRSTKNIIDFNNQLYEKLPALLQQQLNALIEEQEDVDLSAWWHKQAFENIITAIYAGATQQAPATVTSGGVINFHVLKEDEAGNALTKITFREASLKKMIVEIDHLINEKKYAPKDICILVRSNAEAIAVVETLMTHNVAVISGEALLIEHNNVVKLLINTLQVLIGLPENTALYKANCISLFAKLHGKELSADSFFNLNFKNLNQLQALLPPELCQHWQAWIQQPLPGLLEKLIQAYGLDQPAHAAQLPYLLALQDLVGDFTRQGEKGIAAFLNYWEEEGVRKALPSSENAEAVQVITIHKSKGLAFRAVLLPFCNWDINGKSNGIFWVDAAGTPYHQLKSIPLKYSRELSQSAVGKAYLEELLHNNVDALNMLYVATTRAIDYLYISVQGKKATTLTTIGDLLGNVLQDGLSAEGTLLMNEPVQVQKAVSVEANMLEMDFYPTSSRLTQIFDAGLRNREIDLLTGKDVSRIGTILHEVLARATDTRSAEEVLSDMLREGLFKAEELANLRQQATAVLNNPELGELFGRGYENRSEKSIIDVQGKSYRPDKMLINGKEVILIDYKFTQQESEAHIEQVDNYKKLLLDMGYDTVKTYLFYAITGRLKLV